VHLQQTNKQINKKQRVRLVERRGYLNLKKKVIPNSTCQKNTSLHCQWAQEVMPLTSMWEVSGSNLSQHRLSQLMSSMVFFSPSRSLP